MDTPLVCIRLHSDVAHTCLAHALTTEVQEIMGLLLGYYEDCDRLAIISRCMVLSRKDKAKDRVEVSNVNKKIQLHLSNITFFTLGICRLDMKILPWQVLSLMN